MHLLFPTKQEKDRDIIIAWKDLQKKILPACLIVLKDIN
jgi:hypothetical protein